MSVAVIFSLYIVIESNYIADMWNINFNLMKVVKLIVLVLILSASLLEAFQHI